VAEQARKEMFLPTLEMEASGRNRCGTKGVKICCAGSVSGSGELRRNLIFIIYIPVTVLT
jgi:hypothetical protein